MDVAVDRDLQMSKPGRPDDQAAEQYQSLDHLINRYDAEGLGPLRKGEEPFRWSFVETEARSLLERTPDLRVAIWLLRSLIVQKGLPGLCEGLRVISTMLREPAGEVWPAPEDGEHAREAHAISLGWLGSEAFLALLQVTRAHPEGELKLGEVAASSTASDVLTLQQREATTSWLRGSRDELQAIRACILDAGAWWDRDPVTAAEFISDLIRLLAPVNRSMQDTGEGVPAVVEPRAEWTAAADGTIGPIQTRDDVRKIVDLALIYYKKNEPAHPASILLHRLRRTIDASFEEVLEEFFAEAPSLIDRMKSPSRQA